MTPEPTNREQDPESPDTEEVGLPIDRIGDYELLAEIGRGGSGVVFKARQVSLGRLVALKLLLAGPDAPDDAERRFRAETEAVAALDHPGIVPIYEAGEHEGQHYLAMKLIEGHDLTYHLPELQDEVHAVARIVAQTARAIQHAHDRGVLHRDLKPANVLLDARGNPQVTDFGLARLFHEGSTQTTTGVVLGTPAYLAPECTAGVAEATASTDVYGLGVILYELLVGHPPFRGRTTLQTLRMVLEEPPIPPRRLRRGVDHRLDAICLKCLEKTPS
jgi:serine/threonine-protein kinase